MDTVIGDLAVILQDRVTAREYYTAAAELAATCGNRIWVEQATGRLRALG